LGDPGLHGRGFGCEFAGGFFAGLETPKLIRKKRKPVRRESRRFMRFLQIRIAQGGSEFDMEMALVVSHSCA
jgi:hypothetical protein